MLQKCGSDSCARTRVNLFLMDHQAWHRGLQPILTHPHPHHLHPLLALLALLAHRHLTVEQQSEYLIVYDLQQSIHDASAALQ